MCTAKPDTRVTMPPPNGLRGVIQFHMCGTCAREVMPNPALRDLLTWELHSPGAAALACERVLFEKYVHANAPRN